jgi:hypothetical protein
MHLHYRSSARWEQLARHIPDTFLDPFRILLAVNLSNQIRSMTTEMNFKAPDMISEKFLRIVPCT